jgi:hypothetical protein
VIEKTVRDAGLLGDVADARPVVPGPREDPHGGSEDLPTALLLGD